MCLASLKMRNNFLTHKLHTGSSVVELEHIGELHKSPRDVRLWGSGKISTNYRFFAVMSVVTLACKVDNVMCFHSTTCTCLYLYLYLSPLVACPFNLSTYAYRFMCSLDLCSCYHSCLIHDTFENV